MTAEDSTPSPQRMLEHHLFSRDAGLCVSGTEVGVAHTFPRRQPRMLLPLAEGETPECGQEQPAREAGVCRSCRKLPIHLPVQPPLFYVSCPHCKARLAKNTTQRKWFNQNSLATATTKKIKLPCFLYSRSFIEAKGKYH